MRRITIVALVTVLALIGAACGGDDDDASSDTTEASDDGSTTDDGGDDGGDDGSSTAGGLADVIEGMGGCTGAAAAVSAAMFSGLNPEAAEQIAENRDQFEDFASSVPDDIKDDVELFASYIEAYSDALKDLDPADYTDPEKAAEIGEDIAALEEEFPQEDIQAASDNISAWFTDECPALAGE